MITDRDIDTTELLDALRKHMAQDGAQTIVCTLLPIEDGVDLKVYGTTDDPMLAMQVAGILLAGIANASGDWRVTARAHGAYHVLFGRSPTPAAMQPNVDDVGRA